MTLGTGKTHALAAGGAQAVRDAIDALDPALGPEMHAAVRELYPVARSITGEGLRRSLRKRSSLHGIPPCAMAAGRSAAWRSSPVFNTSNACTMPTT